MSRIRAIDKREADCVDAPCNNVVAGGRDVAWIFPGNGSSNESRGLRADALRECISVVSSKGLGTLPPIWRILGRSFAGRVRHAEPRTEGWCSKDTGIEGGLGHVVTKFIAETELGRSRWPRPCRIGINRHRRLHGIE